MNEEHTKQQVHNDSVMIEDLILIKDLPNQELHYKYHESHFMFIDAAFDTILN